VVPAVPDPVLLFAVLGCLSDQELPGFLLQVRAGHKKTSDRRSPRLAAFLVRISKPEPPFATPSPQPAEGTAPADPPPQARRLVDEDDDADRGCFGVGPAADELLDAVLSMPRPELKVCLHRPAHP